MALFFYPPSKQSYFLAFKRKNAAVLHYNTSRLRDPLSLRDDTVQQTIIRFSSNTHFTYTHLRPVTRQTFHVPGSHAN